MLNFSKSTIAILTLGLTLSLAADFAEAGRGRRGGSNRSRSMNRSSRGSSRSMGRRSSHQHRSNFKQNNRQIGKRTSSNKIGNRTNNTKIGNRMNNNKIDNRFKNKNNSSRLGNKTQKTNEIRNNSKRNITKRGNHRDNHRGHKNKHHGHHKGHKHHKHHWHGWRGWYRPVVWGINYYRPAPVYCNPYCSSISVDNSFGYPGQSQNFDYSQPIMDQNNDMTEKGAQLMQEARQAFLEENYQSASRIIATAAQEMPKNHDVHQLRSLILFALQDYSNSAGAAHAALTGGPGWNWTTLRSFYNDKETYTQQLRQLEDERAKRSKAPELRFLLGYHYLMMNHVESAARELAIAVELEPRDELSKKLFNAISSKNGSGNNSSPSEKPVEKEYQVPAPPETLDSITPKVPTPEKTETSYYGVFNASPAEGVNFKLELKTDGKFVWAIDDPKNKTEFAGTFQIEKNILTLTRDKDGEKMIAVITPQEKGFNFKMQNGDPKDPGLNFLVVK